MNRCLAGFHHRFAGTASSNRGSDTIELEASSLREKRLLRTMLIAASIVALGFAGYALLTNRPVSVRVATVEETVPVRVFGLGTVEARVLSKIGFEVGATGGWTQVDLFPVEWRKW